MEALDILEFWFGAEPRKWFSKDDAFDQAISDRFSRTLSDAEAGLLSHWEHDLRGLQALIILYDQFPRNMYRSSAKAFAFDDEALRLSHMLVAHQDWEWLTSPEKQFGVMPMMHSEDLAEQKLCLMWMERIGNSGAIRAAKTHMDIIARFGRFPHRNQVLGRETTAEERDFLESGGFSG